MPPRTPPTPATPRRYGPRVPEPLRVRLLQVGRVGVDARWAHAGVCSLFWRLYAQDAAGAALLDAAGAEHPLDPGAVHLVPAWHRFDTRGPARGRVGHLFLHFELPGLPRGWAAAPRPLAVPLDPGIAAALFALRADLPPRLDPAVDPPPPPPTLLRARALLDATLAAACARFPRLAEGVGEAAGPELAPALDAIHGAVAAGRPAPAVAALAAACHTSERTLLRRFRERLGSTPHRFATEQRLAAAAEQLAHTDRSVEAVAAATGHRDRSSFSRAFTRRFGVSPARFRDAPLV